MEEDPGINIVVPQAALTDYDSKHPLDNLLRVLTRELFQKGLAEVHSGLLGGQWGYGTSYENETFLIHHYCWCEREDCPWCAGCTCPETAYHYLIDNQEVTFKEWIQYYEDRVPYPSGQKNWKEISQEVNTHRSERHDPICDFCLKGEKPAPNFWHKPSDFKVWWYKWIGRDMEVQDPNNISQQELTQSCLGSLNAT